MNAIKFLIKEHDKVRHLFADIDSGTHKESIRKKLFENLCDELIRHEKMEEAIWYPYLRKNKNLMATIKHLISEEKNAEKAIESFSQIKTDEKWEEKFQKLKIEVENHAHEEETKLFPKVQELLSEDKLELIGKEMYQFKLDFINS